MPTFLLAMLASSSAAWLAAASRAPIPISPNWCCREILNSKAANLPSDLLHVFAAQQTRGTNQREHLEFT